MKKIRNKKYYSFKIIISLTIFILIISSCTQKQAVRTINIHLKTVDDIKELDSNIVKPYDYHPVISLNGLSIKQKKDKFISLMLPSILIAKENIKYNQNKLGDLMEKDTLKYSPSDEKFLISLRNKYGISSLTEIYKRLNTHPNSIVLAQAIIESGWGCSRFFGEAYNVFGIWSFDEQEPRVKANHSRKGKAIYLKKYNNLSESIEDYFLTIAKGPFSDFRKERSKENNELRELLPLLRNYSEMGKKYTDDLAIIISSNHLTDYDQYYLDSQYIRN
jgi:Bax protein